MDIKVGASTRKQQKQWLSWLVENKEIKILDHVESVSDPDTHEPYYNMDNETGILRVHVAPIQPDIKDNDMIEKYLAATFGTYKTFFKEYMATYAYTNFRRLPTLVLYGPRGGAKSTTSGMLADMFPRLCCDWTGEVSNYSPEAEKKLAVIEENSTIDKQQYKTLKKYTGQPYLTVNKKYQPIYKVRNNLSVILISNDNIPLYVEKDEMPTSPKNNQFFV